MEVRRRKRAVRQNSNVLAMFTQAQITEFKEAFSMIDQDNDGFIEQDDLCQILSSLGQVPNEDYINSLLSLSPGPINFTMFLTMFGEKLSILDPEYEILQAFECFDDKRTGSINVEELREYMLSMGEQKFTEEEFDRFIRGVPIDSNNCFNYHQLLQSLGQLRDM